MECSCPVSLPGPSIANTCGPASVLFMGLLEQFIRSQCDIEDPCGQFSPPKTLERDYDFIVVGGGTAGSVVASRLSEVPEWKVLVIEAGVNEPIASQVPSMGFNFFGSSIDWSYLTEPEEKACLASKEKRCHWPRGKVIGGTSVVHGMMYMRGSRKDFDDWEKLGNTGWSYKDVLPYFKKSENNLQLDQVGTAYHSEGGYLPVSQFPYHPPLADAILQGAEELGQRVGDLNGESHTGFSIAQTTNRNGIRYSTARAFLRPAKNRKNLHVLLNTTVTKVLVDAGKKQAYGVEVINSEGKKQTFIAKKEVIVSGGAVNSPQILLLSGIGPKEDLEKVKVPVVHNLPGVGKNLHNHVALKLPFYMNDNATTALNWATAMQYLLYRDGLMSGTGMSQLTGMINTKYSNPKDDNPDIQFFFAGYGANCAKTGEVGELMKEKQNGAAPKREITIIPTVLHPKSTGYLTLKDNNPITHPKIYGKYLTNQYDVLTLIEGVRFALKLVKTKALQKYGLEYKKTPNKECDSKQFGSDQYWECLIRWHTGPENHQAGSCKMGPVQDPLAVVDPELRVHGVKNVRVMDASIMPRVTSGNTGAPVIMVAEKGCDMIKKQWTGKVQG